jgi:hypothetical protein
MRDIPELRILFWKSLEWYVAKSGNKNRQYGDNFSTRAALQKHKLDIVCLLPSDGVRIPEEWYGDVVLDVGGGVHPK